MNHRYLPQESIWSAAWTPTKVFSLGLAMGASACNLEVNSTVNSGRSAPSACSTPTANGTPLPDCERFEVFDVNKIIVTPGEEVTLTGRHFRPGMILASDSPSEKGSEGGAEVKKLEIRVQSDASASFVMPTDTPFGLVKLTLRQDEATRKLTLFSNGLKTDHPIITAGAERICRGEKFYDGSGVLQEGTKACVTGGAGREVAECASDGAVGCLAVSAFKAVDMSKLTPANIKANVTIAGVTGTYPSNTAPLATDTATPDLTSFGAGTPVGIYEFFDRAGTVYSATVADFGPVTPTTATQNINNASTLYRQVSVSGDTNLAAGKITSGTTIFGVAGNVTLPSANKVFLGTSYGVGGTGSSGTLTLPLASNVVQGSSTYGDPGSPVTPAYSISFPSMIVRPMAPTVTGVSFNFSPDRVTLTWGAVTGASGYIVLMNKTQAVSWTPTDGATYMTGTHDSDTMIYAGPGTSVTHNTPVTAGTTFYFAIYSYQANQVYSYTPSTRTMLSCAGLLGGTWVPVPGDSVYGTNGFCVQKYVPTNVSGVPTSQAGSPPWVSISQTDATSACSNLGPGYHLITNPEWMTIAANIANLGSNWSGGSVGSGTLSRGHSDSSPAQFCAPDGDDTKAWVETDCTGQIQGALAFNQRRTQFLSNNYVLWDFGGNIWQWINYNNASDKPNPQSVWVEYPSITGSTTTPKAHVVPLASAQSWWSDTWNSAQGIGRIYPGTNDGTTGALRRGAAWVNGVDAGAFAAAMFSAPTETSTFIALRCAWQP